MRWWRTRSAYCENSRPPRFSALAASMTKLWPCGAGIAWKRETWVGRPVAQALSASSIAGATKAKIFLIKDMALSLFVQVARSGDGRGFVLYIERLAVSQSSAERGLKEARVELRRRSLS